MMKLGDVDLWVGGSHDSRLRHDPAWAVVNTAKTVHVGVMGWSNSPPRNHPNYLSFEDGQFLSFNWVDGPSRLFDWSGPAAFIRALDFIDRWLPEKSVLINCDQGLSRSPSLALLYLAKRAAVLPSDSFDAARTEFELMYPAYQPSGIASYLSTNWDAIT